MKLILNTISSCLAAALIINVSANAQTYTVTKIPQPAGTSGYGAERMNNFGHAVGNTKVKNGRFDAAGPAFVWANGALVNLPPLGTDAAAGANDISDPGLVIGFSPRELGPPSGVPRRAVFWWQKNVGGYEVGDWNAFLPPGSPLSLVDAVAISPDGRFVVFDSGTVGTSQAVVAEVAFNGNVPSGFTGLWLIESLDGSVSSDGFVSSALDISHNADGLVRVVGYANTQVIAQAFLWEKDAANTVRLIDLDLNSTTFSWGQGVNARGEVTGYIGVPGVSKAHFWDAAGSIWNIGTLGGADARANSINDPGYVVGWSQRSGKNVASHAFLWHTTTRMRDLNALKSTTDTSGLELTTAYSINDAGQILARGTSKTLGSVAVLLNPQ